MPGFERYDVVSVPFPYTDRAALERRPALVISQPSLEHRFGLLWVLMITAAENRPWVNDVPIPDHNAAGVADPLDHPPNQDSDSRGEPRAKARAHLANHRGNGRRSGEIDYRLTEMNRCQCRHRRWTVLEQRRGSLPVG